MVNLFTALPPNARNGHIECVTNYKKKGRQAKVIENSLRPWSKFDV